MMQSDIARSEPSLSGIGSDDASLTALLALCALIAITTRTVFHSFWPLTATVAIITLVASGLVTTAVLRGKQNRKLNGWRTIPLLSVVPVGLLAWWNTPTNEDVDLYHHQAIIMHTVGDVPAGMANVHDRLGFVSGIHPLGAILEALGGPSGSRLATTTIALLALSAFGDSLRRMRRGCVLSGDVARVVALSLIATHALLQPSYWLSSPSPDLPFALTTVVASTAGLSVFGTSDAKHESHVLIIFSTLAIWLRPLGIVVVPMVIISLIRQRRLPSARLCATISVTLVVRFLYSLYTSGHLLFPIRTLRWQPPWSVSAESMATTSALVRGWARHAGEDPAVVLADWRWIQWWWSYHGPKLWVLIASLLLSALLIAIRSSRTSLPNDLFALALLFGPVVAWFISAPDPRFALGYLVLPPCVVLSSELRRLGSSPTRQRVLNLVVLSCASLAVASSFLIAVVQHSQSETTNATPGTSTAPEQIVLVPADGRCRRELWCNPQEPVVLSTRSTGPIDYVVGVRAPEP